MITLESQMDVVRALATNRTRVGESVIIHGERIADSLVLSASLREVIFVTEASAEKPVLFVLTETKLGSVWSRQERIDQAALAKLSPAS